MQEVLLKAVPQLSRFDSPKALVVWLYKVAKSRCLMSRRRSKFAPKDLSLEELMPDRRELEQLGADRGINPENFAIQSQTAETPRAAIQKLPAQYRIVLVLRDMEGLTDEESRDHRLARRDGAGATASRAAFRAEGTHEVLETQTSWVHGHCGFRCNSGRTPAGAM